jgi:hypothetical protein
MNNKAITTIIITIATAIITIAEVINKNEK